MSIRQQIVSTAREYLDTPFSHQGRLKGVGIDCAGLVIGVARDLGLEYVDETGYPPVPNGGLFLRTVERVCTPVAADDVLPGDLAVFRFLTEPQHIAIISEIDPLMLIHAWEKMGRCVENCLDATWRRRLVGFYRFRERA